VENLRDQILDLLQIGLQLGANPLVLAVKLIHEVEEEVILQLAQEKSKS
jgi:hypothetical protein